MTPFPLGATPPDGRRVEVPAGIESKADLFAHLREAFPLPDYFGNNWDALEECLNDVDWMPGQSFVLIHHDLPLQPSPSDQRTYLQILATSAKDARRLRVTFPERDRAQIERLLTSKSFPL